METATTKTKMPVRLEGALEDEKGICMPISAMIEYHECLCQNLNATNVVVGPVLTDSCNVSWCNKDYTR